MKWRYSNTHSEHWPDTGEAVSGFPAAELRLKEAHLPTEMGNGLRECLDLLRRERTLSFLWESKQDSSDI